MKKNIIYLLITSTLIISSLFSQVNDPKREFRAAWVSTVANIDWPSSPGISVNKMKEELVFILDYLKDANLNAIIFQIRPACDAMYKSNYEPWSYWLSGQQGKAPEDDFDPLKFALEEAHKRGMELHAWFNPYRVSNNYSFNFHSSNVAVQHPEWVIDVAGKKILDPGIPSVREHVTKVVMDVVKNYDVDGIHFDDYFYLDNMAAKYDSTSFANYKNGFTNLSDWRRNNVNELLRMISTSIKNEKPHVKFGQSPRGIWKNGVPAGIVGSNNYEAIYCDAVTWLNEQIIDYLAPQLYWSFGGGQDYGKLLPWWVSVRNERHIYAGLPFYRVEQSGGIDRTQLGKMINLNRNTIGSQGQIFFTANNFQKNFGNNTDSLKQKYFKNKALIPIMEWKEITPPQAPTNLKFSRTQNGNYGINWKVNDNTDSKWFVLYKFKNSSISQDDLKNPENIYDISSNKFFILDSSLIKDERYFVVTALDRNNNESSMSNLYEFNVPNNSILKLPLNADNQKDTVKFVWNEAQNASSYILELAENNSFSNLSFNIQNITDTTYSLTGLKGKTKYYWRLKSKNFLGTSNYSEIRNFTTLFASSPIIIAPSNQSQNISLQPTLIWNKTISSLNYDFEIYEGDVVDINKLLLYKTITDTSYTLSDSLKPGTFYSLRVRVKDQNGISLWTNLSIFKTLDIIPGAPINNSPNDNEINLGKNITFNWTTVKYANNYELEISKDSNFNEILIKKENIINNSIEIEDLEGESIYYWRTRACNNSGKSIYSNVLKFATGFPSTPILLYPINKGTNLPLVITFNIKKSKVATSYQVQLYEGIVISSQYIVTDTLITDTLFTSKVLQSNKIYSWRAKSRNSIDESPWSLHSSFKTTSSTDIIEIENIPVNLKLYQNYPNPFNPSTTIKYDLPEESNVKIVIHNILGEEIKTLKNEYNNAGTYTVIFDAGNLSSGIYFYTIITDKKRIVNKMLLIK